MSYLSAQLDSVSGAMPFGVCGQVHGISGLTLEAAELPLPVGSLCRVHSLGGRTALAEVIGFRHDHTLLMPLSPVRGVARGDRIENIAANPRIPLGDTLLGRVLDGFGHPIDGRPPIPSFETRRIDARSVAPLRRQNIHQ